MADATPTAAPAANSPATESAVAESTESTNEAAPEATAEAGQANSTSKSPAAKATKKAPEPEKKSNKKTLKLKIDGQDVDEEFDPDDEEALVKHLQLSKVAQKRMAEKATYEKQVAQFFQMLQNDPAKAMKELGMDPEDFAVKTLQKKIEDEQKSPEQRELERTKRELEEYRAQIKAQEDERKNAEREQLNAQQEQAIEEGMISALEQTQLPNEPLVVRRIAEIMLTAVENNLDIAPLAAAQIAKKELEADMKQYLTVLPDEALEALVGKDRIGSLRKKQVAAMKKAAETPNPNAIKSTGQNTTDKKEPQKKKISMRDFVRG